MKVWVKWMGVVVTCVALFYFGLKFRDQLDEALPLILDWGNAGWLLLGALLVAPQMVFAALAWRCFLGMLGNCVSVSTVVRIVFLSQFARYVPGNVGHHIGKLALAKQAGVPLKIGTASILLETVVVLFFGLAISAYYLPQQLLDLLVSRDWTGQLITVCIIAVLVGIYLVKKGVFFSKFSELKNYFVQQRVSTIRVMSQVTFCYLINFLFIGGLAWLLATQVFGAFDLSFLELTSIMAFAWTVGFLAPGAPAGLGVREFIALALLGDSYSSEVAMGLLVLHRLVLTIGDLLTFLMGLSMARSSKAMSVSAS